MLSLLSVVDNFLNSITMYKLVLYGLMVISILAIFLGFLGLLPYSGVSLLISYLAACSVCFGLNYILGVIFKAPVNAESWAITAHILFLIMWPISGVDELYSLVAVCAIAIGSKFILAINKKHIFNPAAIGAAALTLSGNANVNWWVGSLFLFPATLILGLLVVRKIRRFYLFFSFLTASVTVLTINTLIKGLNLSEILIQTFISGPLIFFGTIMMTEPQTTPPGRKLQMIYGGLTGALFSSQIQIMNFLMTPEIALIGGNVFSYIVSPKQKLILTLKEKIKLSPSIYEFIFSPNQKLNFIPGQYLEWTIPNKSMDLRGNRRYFTIASSPSENDIRLGIKMAKEPSSFKKALSSMENGSLITASQLSGDFILESDSNEKLVFIAGGIGVTPFRSIIKKLVDSGEKKSIVLFYTNVIPEDFVYKDIFKQAEMNGVKTVYILSDKTNVPNDWKGKTGYITEEMIKDEVSDYKGRKYYLSGPTAMVNSYKKLLASLGIPMNKIITDYFPGF